MRVLVAYDGSDGATKAVDLVGSAAWPSASLIRVVTVVEPNVVPSRAPWRNEAMVTLASTEDADRNAEAVRRLRSPDRSVEGAVLHGRPATVVVDEAHTFGADVIVMGSRGRGQIASLLLGSVSAEVTDQAGCPVLIARSPAMTQVVLATDESPSALAAESIVIEWPIFAALSIRVVSVAETLQPTSGVAPFMVDQVRAAHADYRQELTAAHQRAADEAADRLRRAGRSAEPEMVEGDAAAEIIAVADERSADLIVLGSRGRTGVKRLLLGSVARNVLAGTKASVLVVHERNRPKEP